VDWITDEERRRIAELVAEGAPPWKLRQEINRSRHAIRRCTGRRGGSRSGRR
jgi:hypothetical protein